MACTNKIGEIVHPIAIPTWRWIHLVEIGGRMEPDSNSRPIGSFSVWGEGVSPVCISRLISVSVHDIVRLALTMIVKRLTCRGGKNALLYIWNCTRDLRLESMDPHSPLLFEGLPPHTHTQPNLPDVASRHITNTQ